MMEQNQNRAHLIMEIQIVSQETAGGGANINVVFTRLPQKIPSNLLGEIAKIVATSLEAIPEKLPEMMAPPIDMKLSDKPNIDGSVA